MWVGKKEEEEVPSKMRKMEGKRARTVRAREKDGGEGEERIREREPEKKLWVPVRGRTAGQSRDASKIRFASE